MSFLDLSNVEESSFDPIPAGVYYLNSEDAEVKETKTIGGEYIQVTFTVVGGEFMGRKLFETFNIKNANQKAVDIGLGQLKRFMRCAGKENFMINTVSDLCGLTVKAQVIIEEDDKYGDKNRVKKFLEVKEGEKAPTETVKKNSVPDFEAEDIPF